VILYIHSRRLSEQWCCIKYLPPPPFPSPSFSLFPLPFLPFLTMQWLHVVWKYRALNNSNNTIKKFLHEKNTNHQYYSIVCVYVNVLDNQSMYRKAYIASCKWNADLCSVALFERTMCHQSHGYSLIVSKAQAFHVVPGCCGNESSAKGTAQGRGGINKDSALPKQFQHTTMQCLPATWHGSIMFRTQKHSIVCTRSAWNDCYEGHTLWVRWAMCRPLWIESHNS